MAEQNVRIAKDSQERVAYDLMVAIASLYAGPKDPKYFFSLYRQCYKAVHGYNLEQILKED